MRKFLPFILLLLVFCVAPFANSQEMKVSGFVYDTTGVKPLRNVMVTAVRIKDSLLLGFDRTKADGSFVLKGFPIDTFSLTIEYPGLDDKIYYMFGHDANKTIDIPSIAMAAKSQELEEVIIYANKNPIYYRGDTLVYVADSFKVHEGAVVEDLLKKLPGLSVDKEGKITSQGQAIDQVLVDGDEFFGSDPTIATKNLAADGIKTVELYEKENDQGIGGSDDKIKVLDLRLKDSAKKGYFGRVSGASDFALTPINNKIGTNPFYEGEMLLSRFDGSQKVSVFALATNTPRSSFGRGDLNKFGLGNEKGANSMPWEDNASNTSGIPQTFKAGAYFTDKIGKNKGAKIGFNYSYYNTQLEAISASRSQYYLTDTTYFTDDSTRNFSRNESHNVNFSFKAPLDSLTTLEIKPSFSYDIARDDNADLTTFINGNDVQSLQTSVGNNNKSEGLGLSGMARINRKFKKKKRELEVRYDVDFSDNKTDGNLNTTTRIFVPLYDSIVDQRKDNNNSSQNHYATVTYIEPIAKKLKLEFQYLYEFGISKQSKETYDFNNNEYNSFRTDLSNSFESTRQQHRGGIELIFQTSKHTIQGGAKVRNIDIDNDNLITGVQTPQNFNNVLPTFRYEYKPSVSKRFSIDYSTSSSQPSINDLQPVPDNSNPNRIAIGNPDLTPNYAHNIRVNFNTWQAMTGRYVYAGGLLNLTEDGFTNSTVYDNFGRAVSQTVNTDGTMYAVVFAGAGLPLYKQIITLNPNLNTSFNRFISYINTEKNTTDNFAITGQLDLDFRWDSLEVTLNSSYTYNNPQSSLSAASSNPYTNQAYGAEVVWRLPHGFKIGVDGTYNKNAQKGEGFYNIEYFILNAEVSKSFLKTGNLVLAIQGNDIFNQNISASRQVNGNIITDYRTTIISRYFLLKLTYRFNNNKTKEEDQNGWH
ncbi:MAG: outer membrane beta-barrel family protein [Crocinitomicaceae bacterium]